MARTLGTYILSSNIEIEAGAPLDARTIVPLKADLTRAGSFPYPYVGMEVFVTEELQKYRLIGTNPELTDNWTKTDKGVVDGYYDTEHGGFYKDQGFTKPITGTSEVLYIDKSTDNVYRWNGSAFAQINPIDYQVPTIDMADERTNIAQDDDIATVMGKVAKYFDDLGDVAFSDDYGDLSNTPTKLSQFDNDAGFVTGDGFVTSVKVGNTAYNPTDGVVSLPQYPDISGKADKATTLAGYGITDAKIANGTITLGSNTITPLTQHQDISGKADKATTLAGYGITDAKIASGTITLGANTITPLTQHQDISGKADKATTLAGYGITDAKIASGTITLGSNTITPLTQHQSVTDNNPTLSWGTKSKVATIGSTAINVTMPSNPNTDTKVTSVGNHYAPAEDLTAQLDADASSSTAATWNSTSLVTGVTVKRDAKGHVTGLAVDSIKMPANPNTNTTYTFADGTNGFTVTPSGGTAQTVKVTPSITNNVTGSGTSGYLAKFNGANTITSGPQLGSGTTTYLRNDGSWATPPDTNTTYTIATGDSNGQIKVTPSSGSSYNVSVKGLGSSAYTTEDSISPYEANLRWGGKNFTGSYGPIDAALMDELGANRFQFIKASAITVEYSRDGGSTWTDYGATDAQKQQIFAQGGGLSIGKHDSSNKATANGGKYKLRITIDTGAANVYSWLNKFVIYCSTNGSAGCYCQIQIALQSTPTTFIDHTSNISISGWSGYNVLNTSGFTTYGNSPTGQYGRVRFIFGDGTGGNTNYNGLNIIQIKAFGGVGWSTPSTMAKSRHLYSYDENQNATFPANVTSTKFIGPVADSGDNTGTTFAYSKTDITYANLNSIAVWNNTGTGYEIRAISKNNFARATTTTNIGIDAPGHCAIAYVSGLTKMGWNFQQNDGALYTQYYNSSWIHEIFADYRTGQISLRGKNNGTWQDWRMVLDSSNYTNYTVKKDGTGASGSWGISITGTATKATQDGDGNVITSTYSTKSETTIYKGNLSATLGSGTPAAATKTYWENNSNIPIGTVNTAYNTSGAEYTLILSKGGSNSYGSVLKYGYTDRYLYILRRSGGTWQSTDWEKIYAGYADTAGSATSATNDSAGNNISSTYMKKGVDYVTAGQLGGTTVGSNATIEGNRNTASEAYSHAEGFETVASGICSHSEGSHTIAASAYQLAIGQYNEEDANGWYYFIIGNGTSSTRKNIFTVHNNGQAWSSGGLATDGDILSVYGDLWAGQSTGLANSTKIPTGADVTAFVKNFIKVVTRSYSRVAITTRSGSGAYYCFQERLPAYSGYSWVSISLLGWTGSAANVVPYVQDDIISFMTDISQTVGTLNVKLVYVKNSIIAS